MRIAVRDRILAAERRAVGDRHPSRGTDRVDLAERLVSVAGFDRRGRALGGVVEGFVCVCGARMLGHRGLHCSSRTEQPATAEEAGRPRICKTLGRYACTAHDRCARWAHDMNIRPLHDRLLAPRVPQVAETTGGVFILGEDPVLAVVGG